MSVIAGSVSLRAPISARGLGFKTSQPTGTRVAAVTPARPFTKSGRTGLRVNAGNTNEGGLFAPIVIVARNVIGVKRFNQIRGKAIALHSQVITDFCKEIGADGKVRQGLIRTAKNNGGRLGFLA